MDETYSRVGRTIALWLAVSISFYFPHAVAFSAL